MKNMIIALAATLAVSVTAFAEDGKAAGRRITPVPASKMAEFNAKTGGLVDPPANSKVVLLLDARRNASPSMTNFIAAAERMLSIRCERRAMALADAECPRKAAFDAKKGSAAAVILFYERGGEPTLSAFPEDAVALVNTAPLLSADANEQSRRFSKEFWRSLGFALGGYGDAGADSRSSMTAVYSLADLDALRAFGLAPRQAAAIAASVKRLGVFGRNPIPYSRACREGWAPAPTNECQKAIWERFKAEANAKPSNPIKITKEKK